MGGSEHLELSGIPIAFCPDSNLSILIFLSVTSSSQYGQVVLSVEIMDSVKTINYFGEMERQLYHGDTATRR